MQSLLAFVIIALVRTLPLCSCYPGVDGRFSSSSSNTMSSANGYQVTLSETNTDGKCISSLAIIGNGIHKTVEYPCSNAPTSVINLNKTLLVGEYFSDTPSVLVRVVGDKCEKEVFQEDHGKFTSTVEPLDEKDCEKIRIKMVIAMEQQKKWNEWYKNQQQHAQHQLEQLQHNLQSAQDQLFGNIFGGK